MIGDRAGDGGDAAPGAAAVAFAAPRNVEIVARHVDRAEAGVNRCSPDWVGNERVLERDRRRIIAAIAAERRHRRLDELALQAQLERIRRFEAGQEIGGMALRPGQDITDIARHRRVVAADREAVILQRRAARVERAAGE